ncbi:MAG TPA: hypothetical protein VF622_16160 [Segetibacter sp.]|jgi:protocatechuate 3,4-dioxygenase beta subunit
MCKTSFLIYTLLFLSATSCSGQLQNPDASKPNDATNNRVGGRCDGCESMFINMPGNINSIDTSKGWNEKGQKLIITGKVFHIDGKTPASGILIYYYQTDQTGTYVPEPGVDRRVNMHGRLRGWIKSDKEGNYCIYTTRPAPYPGRTTPAHLHVLIKEPNIKNEYYLDDWVFDDDPILTSQMRRSMENRGGSGILRIVLDDSVQIVEHNIVLGRNIPNYPKVKKDTVQSGLEIGEDNPSFMPIMHGDRTKEHESVLFVCMAGTME